MGPIIPEPIAPESVRQPRGRQGTPLLAVGGSAILIYLLIGFLGKLFAGLTLLPFTPLSGYFFALMTASLVLSIWAVKCRALAWLGFLNLGVIVLWLSYVSMLFLFYLQVR
jgi:hypothetical protein